MAGPSETQVGHQHALQHRPGPLCSKNVRQLFQKQKGNLEILPKLRAALAGGALSAV
jgi:hypothetical protein